MQKENNVILKKPCPEMYGGPQGLRTFHAGRLSFIKQSLSSPRNSVGDLPRTAVSVVKQVPLCNSCPSPMGERVATGRARGFTLLELLIVVLIIGILAAVVLPQYQKAVYKSRAMEAVTILNAITNAEEVYYLANGEYTGDITELDVNVPEELITTFGNTKFKNKYSYSCSRKTECWAGADNENLPDFQFNFTTGRTDANAGKFYCNLGSGDSKNNMAKSICQSLGRVDESRTQAWDVGKYFIIN